MTLSISFLSVSLQYVLSLSLSFSRSFHWVRYQHSHFCHTFSFLFSRLFHTQINTHSYTHSLSFSSSLSSSLSLSLTLTLSLSLSHSHSHSLYLSQTHFSRTIAPWQSLSLRKIRSSAGRNKKLLRHIFSFRSKRSWEKKLFNHLCEKKTYNCE